jgi:hypothetical protein
VDLDDWGFHSVERRKPTQMKNNQSDFVAYGSPAPAPARTDSLQVVENWYALLLYRDSFFPFTETLVYSFFSSCFLKGRMSLNYI